MSRVTRKQAEEKVEKAKAFAIKNNPHHIPVKGENQSGEGRYHEQLWNLHVRSYEKALTCQGVGQYDSVKYITIDGKRKKVYIECKINCGNLGVQDKDGNISGVIFNCDFVVYNPLFRAESSTIYDSVVLTRDEFLEILVKHGKFRTTKMSGTMCKKPKENRYYDLVGIQSYLNGKNGGKDFIDDIYFTGMSVADFCEIYQVRTDK